MLVKCGVSPVDMLFSKRTFDVEPHVTPIEVDIPRLPSRSIAVRTQMSALRKVLQAPLGTVGGSGFKPLLQLGTDEMIADLKLNIVSAFLAAKHAAPPTTSRSRARFTP